MSEENQNQYPNETTIHFLSKTITKKSNISQLLYFFPKSLETNQTNP